MGRTPKNEEDRLIHKRNKEIFELYKQRIRDASANGTSARKINQEFINEVREKYYIQTREHITRILSEQRRLHGTT